MVKKSGKRPRKFIVITGGPMSGLGKGTAAASIGRILAPNYRVLPIKFDGYLNADPGTQNPEQHGEVFILDDGREVDMDFGHYERFIGVNCKIEWSITMGRVLDEIREKERNGNYAGETIRYVPHVVEHIQEKILSISDKENADVVLIEIGGTPWQDESRPGIESVRRLKDKVGEENILYCHLTWIDYLRCVQENKTALAQIDLEILRRLGITPDILIARCETVDGIDDEKKNKIADASGISIESIMLAPDTKTIYEIPLNFYNGEIFDMINDRLLNNKSSKETRAEARRLDSSMKSLESLVSKIKNPNKKKISIAICGKYMKLQDSYASVREALAHAAANLDVTVDISWVDAEKIENNPGQFLGGNIAGLIVPGGYGKRGIEGMVTAIKYARDNKMPYLGLCYGLQLAVIEFARNVCKMEDAHTTEIDKDTKHPVICIMESQENVTKLGGTQRLGGYDAVLKQGSLVQRLYNSDKCRERHRHRYEVNPGFHEELTKNGLLFSGMSPDGKLVEFIELPQHPFFVGTQAHNELTSKLETPNPLFFGFVKAAIKYSKS